MRYVQLCVDGVFHGYEVDASPRNGTKFFEDNLGEVLLIARKTANLGTMGNQMVNRGMQRGNQ
jgi:hypothetical protein